MRGNAAHVFGGRHARRLLVDGMTALAEAQGVNKTFGVLPVLKDVDFSVTEGSTAAIIGESGCGKTTLGRTLLLLEKPDSGAVRFGDKDLGSLAAGDLRTLRQKMQMVFQDPYSSLNPRMSIGESLADPLIVHGIATWRGAREKVAETLRMVGLDPAVAPRYPHAFSGGQRQRIAIARAVIAGPRLVVADEPLSALDITIQGQILDLFTQLQETLGLTYVFISHDLPTVRHFADTVSVMLGGRIVEQGPPADMFAAPAHPYTKKLLESVPIPDPALERSRLAHEVPMQARAAPSGAASLCPFVARCPHAMRICNEMLPPLQDIAAHRQAACWLNEGLS
jgi:oligopeptide/dipeptide ABC transporter ATP-binding protein